MKKQPMITNIHKNVMGTTSFSLKIEGMRKSQDFIVYPIQAGDLNKTIKIQSDTRIGLINPDNGVGLMSKPHASGAYFVHLQTDKLARFQLSQIDLQSLRLFIFTTAGDKAGQNAMHIYCDNSNAINIL